MTTERKLTGWHVFGIFAVAFGVIIAVNVLLAVKAAGSFPGLVVKNSYVASQTFNDRKAAQVSLGWDLNIGYLNDKLVFDFRDQGGQPVQLGSLDILIGRATNVSDDITAQPLFNGSTYDYAVPLKDGVWVILVTAKAQDGTLFEQRRELFVKGS